MLFEIKIRKFVSKERGDLPEQNWEWAEPPEQIQLAEKMTTCLLFSQTMETQDSLFEKPQG